MFRKGIVVEVHPQDHSVDLVMADDGSRLIGVQVTTPNGSTRSGTVDLPEIPKRSDKWDVTTQTGQDMHALVGFVGRHPVVFGFLYPQVNQMTHDDPKLKVSRHQSDVVTTIDGDGNTQFAHPSGLFITIGASPDKIDYAGKNSDADSAVDRNTSTTPYVRLSMAGSKSVLTIEPSGKWVVTSEDEMDFHAKGNITVKTDGAALVQAATSVTIDTPETIVTGNLTVQGDTSVQAIVSRDHNISSTHRHVNSGGPATGGPPE